MVVFLKIRVFEGYKMVFLKKDSLLLTIISLFVLLAGCGSVKVVEEEDQYISAVKQIDIPDDVKIIGLGRQHTETLNFKS
ncbi:hypothetical protein M5V91_05855 [Cytobacillus pseudoceanisediminis]|uniref:hypothetical protein n=1 Tax=Cytobacillus pseudoceanisediminis TaxID=3051614 RepID=UPI00218BA2B1|nr:hypothetical protein [Cytobacillus pseudoceanisediminis]UQX55256.1 hypothetical protein M5V91_05855 [Cytobacillus pseudoceanisediminis]